MKAVREDEKSVESNSAVAIFIVGVGRSGTTMVYDMLALSRRHRWISRVEADASPFSPVQRAAWHDHRERMRRGQRRSRWLSPSEAYRWWDRLLPRFRGAASAVLTASDLTDAELRRTARSVQRLTRGNKVFLNKNTRNSRRLGLIANLPGIRAKVIHVVRHPLAVANSLSKVAWWPDMPLWFRAGATPRVVAQGEAEHLALAVELWRREIELIRHYTSRLESDVMTVTYEEVVSAPDRLGEAMAAFALADHPQDVGEISGRFVRRGGRSDWASMLPEALRKQLWQDVREEAERYGYGLP